MPARKVHIARYGVVRPLVRQRAIRPAVTLLGRASAKSPICVSALKSTVKEIREGIGQGDGDPGALRCVSLIAMRLLLTSLCLLFASSAAAQSADPARTIYASRCAGCHGSNGGGGELGPSIVSRVPARTDEELTTVIRQGLPTAGMPASPALSDAEVTSSSASFARSALAKARAPFAPTVPLDHRRSLEGLVLNQGTARPPAAWGRPQDSSPAKGGRSLPAGELTVRLAQLQRPDGRKPLQSR